LSDNLRRVAEPVSSASEFDRVVDEFDFDSVRAFEHEAEAQRQATLERYPRASWATMTLEDYAQGQADHPDNFCRWIERQTDEMGSIRGGSAHKLIVYKNRDKPGWYFPPGYANEQEAWEAVRAGFLRAFDLADQGHWEEIESIEPLTRGAALTTKVLCVYFPDELLPINSSENLRHFLRVVGRGDLADDQALRTIGLNRALLAELRSRPKLADVPLKALERLLYIRFSPFEGRVIKIAPGHDAEFWPEFRDGGFIAVGWDDVPDLRQFESKDAYLAAFRAAYGETYKTANKLKEKANEVWLLGELSVGERIVANKGTREVLAVGTVEPPGYVWMPERATYKHALKVSWDESYARQIPAQPQWAFKTVQLLQGKARALALGEEESAPGAAGETPASLTEEPLLLGRIAEALERKNQAILYGPPGTGKTWHARNFAESWLRERNARTPAARQIASVSAGSADRAWLVTTRPSEWKWDVLFEKGEETFRRGRIDRNYDLISPGDFVFGYTATPDKRIETLARVARLEEVDGRQTFVIAPVARVTDGPTWDELQADEYLKDSEPVRNRMQGTLFSLAPEEAERLMALISERDPAAGSADAAPPAGGDDPLADALEWVTFHPSYSYEDFVEGFRPARSGASLRLEDGIFKTMCERALANPERTYLLVIDEINRAHVTKVLGELITLIEKDKRGSYSVRLPYSKERFVIPPNLFVLGTMNTADRSIKMLDTALRRRFGFVELMPDLALLEVQVGGVQLDDLLGELNRRIAHEAGREKQIGHSFFLKGGQPVSDESEFAAIFRDEVVPLLQEYAADDFDELYTYLGPKIVDRDALTIDVEVLSDPTRLLAALEEHLLGSAAEA
jgi:5-methylcytosine-specific restriction protein B